MKEKDVYAELSSIRDLMERSSKFISLSGLSGVLAGVYALAGAGLVYMQLKKLPTGNSEGAGTVEPVIFWQIAAIAIVVLVLSILTSCLLTMRNAKIKKESVWNPVSKRLLAAVSVPLCTGGLFIIIILVRGDFVLIAPVSLIFYGLALVAGSHYTFTDVKWLGICEILLGLLALILPGDGLLIWTIGFGILHVLYGNIIHFKYER